MGFGKGSVSSPPAYQSPEPYDYSAQIEMMNTQMANQRAMMDEMLEMQSYEAPEFPGQNTSTKVDWQEKLSDLQKKTKVEYGAATPKKGRTSTILTSSLLDDEDAETTSAALSALGGGAN